MGGLTIPCREEVFVDLTSSLHYSYCFFTPVVVSDEHVAIGSSPENIKISFQPKPAILLAFLSKELPVKILEVKYGPSIARLVAMLAT
ncbi:hypothetical protein Gogos_017181 [Gossypium gossypioides]|uniref:Uncharacterized protein n=1 Tax=Gossypium gossypioides TaxID=34282 RepID=A0A7J9BAE0_GOSGO|nr:hypothetical protein [Gossypium gossypioides]